MKKDNQFEKLSDIFTNKKGGKNPPAYEWQDLALQIIKDLAIPGNKKSSVFKICKENSKDYIERCLNDTKELCDGKEKWKYFFKLINQKNQE